jgi:hypothetical protein
MELILCAGKTSERIELLQLDKSCIRVAEYMTELPKRELLEQKLQKAFEVARKQLEAGKRFRDRVDQKAIGGFRNGQQLQAEQRLSS